MMYSHDGGWWWLMVVTSTLFWIAIVAVVIAMVAFMSRTKNRSQAADRSSAPAIVGPTPGAPSGATSSSSDRRS